MKKLLKKHFLLGVIVLSVLIFGGWKCNPEKNSNHEPQGQSDSGQRHPFTGPASIAGIIIDQAGNRITTTPGLAINITDRTGAPFQITLPSAANKFQYLATLANPVAPDNVQGSNSAGSNFYSSYSDNVTGAVKLVIILNNSSPAAAPSLELVFLASTGTLPANIPVTLSTQTAGASVPTVTFTVVPKVTNPVTGITTQAMDLATFPGITPGATYTLSFKNAAGTLITTPQFIMPSPMPTNSTYGFTFIYQ